MMMMKKIQLTQKVSGAFGFSVFRKKKLYTHGVGRWNK
jgi:hypothetical protein